MGWGQEAGSANHVSPSRHYSDSQPITSGLSRHISDSQPITSDSPAATATVSQSRQTPRRYSDSQPIASAPPPTSLTVSPSIRRRLPARHPSWAGARRQGSNPSVWIHSLTILSCEYHTPGLRKNLAIRSEAAPLGATCRALLTSIYREYILTRVGCSVTNRTSLVINVLLVAKLRNSKVLQVVSQETGLKLIRRGVWCQALARGAGAPAPASPGRRRRRRRHPELPQEAHGPLSQAC